MLTIFRLYPFLRVMSFSSNVEGVNKCEGKSTK